MTAPTAKRRRLWVWPAIGLAAVALAWGLLRLGPERLAERRLREAEARVDAIDPGWRLDNVLARREPILPGENSADAVRAAAALIPGRWPDEIPPGRPSLADRIGKQPPNAISEAIRVEIRQALGRIGPATKAALLLAEMPQGRDVPESWPADGLGPTSYYRELSSVVNVLRLEALRRATGGDPEGALTAVRAICNAARSTVGSLSQMHFRTRASIDETAVITLERVLALCEPGELGYPDLTRVLSEEEAAPALLATLRFERSGMYQSLADIVAGTSSAEANGLEKLGGPRSIVRVMPEFLDLASEVIEVAKQPPETWGARMAAIKSRTEKLEQPVSLPAMIGSVEIEQRRLSRFRIARAAVAVERYRLAKGEWPPSLPELVGAGLLEVVPVDPFDGRPVRYVRRADGVTVYSIGLDEADNGGTPEAERASGRQVDMVFRLYDPGERGRR